MTEYGRHEGNVVLSCRPNGETNVAVDHSFVRRRRHLRRSICGDDIKCESLITTAFHSAHWCMMHCADRRAYSGAVRCKWLRLVICHESCFLYSVTCNDWTVSGAAYQENDDVHYVNVAKHQQETSQPP